MNVQISWQMLNKAHGVYMELPEKRFLVELVNLMCDMGYDPDDVKRQYEEMTGEDPFDGL